MGGIWYESLCVHPAKTGSGNGSGSVGGGKLCWVLREPSCWQLLRSERSRNSAEWGGPGEIFVGLSCQVNWFGCGGLRVFGVGMQRCVRVPVTATGEVWGCHWVLVLTRLAPMAEDCLCTPCPMDRPHGQQLDLGFASRVEYVQLRPKIKPDLGAHRVAKSRGLCSSTPCRSCSCGGEEARCQLSEGARWDAGTGRSVPSAAVPQLLAHLAKQLPAGAGVLHADAREAGNSKRGERRHPWCEAGLGAAAQEGSIWT